MQTQPLRFFYDLEFLENGRTVEPISIGVVCSDGQEFYAVNAEMPWRRIRRHPWLAANVVPHLPTLPGWGGQPRLDHGDEQVMTKARIAELLGDFLYPGPQYTVGGQEAELWGWYSAYDHVALMQLWGPMAGKLPWLPMYTRDLQQEADRLGVDLETAVPQLDGAHHALSDARWNQTAWAYLEGLHGARSRWPQ